MGIKDWLIGNFFDITYDTELHVNTKETIRTQSRIIFPVIIAPFLQAYYKGLKITLFM